MAVQQSQQWFLNGVSESRRILQNLSNEQHVQQLKDFTHKIFIWFQQEFRNFYRLLSSFNFNVHIYHKLKNLYNLEGNISKSCKSK